MDIFIGDKPILDYYSGTDHDCKLQPYGDPLYDDVYAVGMTKNFVLKVRFCIQTVVIIGSNVILDWLTNDHLTTSCLYVCVVIYKKKLFLKHYVRVIFATRNNFFFFYI